MKLNKIKKINSYYAITIFFIFILIIAFIIGSIKDLKIAQIIGMKNYNFGIWFSDLGLITSFIPIGISLQIILKFIKRNSFSILFSCDLVMILIVMMALFFKSFKIHNFEFDKLFWLLIYIFIIFLNHFILEYNNNFYQLDKKIVIRAIFVISLVITMALLNSLLKYCFNRPRPKSILRSINEFKNWWDIYWNGLKNHNFSFPSGHATSAVSVVSLALLFEKKDKKKIFILIMTIVIFALVSIARMIMEAHFLTDVSGAGIICFISFLIVDKILINKLDYKKQNKNTF